MLFSSVTFIFYFLPICMICYYLTPKKFKNAALLIFSLAFYFVGEPIYILLLLFSSVVDFSHSLYIEKNRGTKRAKYALISSILINMGMLIYFKYSNFFIENINNVFNLNVDLLRISLPLGISFFTFQTMSYTIDVYRGKVTAQKNLLNMATYVCLFPQLVAGPIVRYTDISVLLEKRRVEQDDIAQGIIRFNIGLMKKVFLANNLGLLVKEYYEVQGESVLFVWLYVLALAMQIYFDFSGYSDMAIGIGRMLGFKFPENFNYPFVAKSITEFWRRWHISLGSWFKDYLYFPLGGSKTSKVKWLRNVFLVWILTGFWHGASWNFVLWGLFYGIVIALEKIIILKYLPKTPVIIQYIYTIILSAIAFIIFDGASVSEILITLKNLFFMGDIDIINEESIYYAKSFAVLLLVSIVAATPIGKRMYKKYIQNSKINGSATVIFVILSLILCSAYLIDGGFNPFLYFRF